MKFIVRRDEYEQENSNFPCQLHFYDKNNCFMTSIHEDWFEGDMLSLGKAVDAHGEVELHLVWPDDLVEGEGVR